MATSAQLEAMPVEDVVAYIEAGRAGYTGTRYGEPFTEAGRCWQQTWTYIGGRLVDGRVIPAKEEQS